MTDSEIRSERESDYQTKTRLGLVAIGVGVVAILLLYKMQLQHTEEMARLATERQCAASKDELKKAVQDAVDAAIKPQGAAGPAKAAAEHVDTASIRLLDAMVSSGSVPQTSDGKVPTGKLIDLVQKIIGMGVDVAKDSPLIKLKNELLSMAREITVAEAKKLIDKYLGLSEAGSKGGAAPAGEGTGHPYAINLTVYGQVNGQTVVPRPPAARGGCVAASAPKASAAQQTCASSVGATPQAAVPH